MQRQMYLVLLVTITYSSVYSDSSNVPMDGARAEACAQACHDAMHWEICAQENGCDSLRGQARLFCMDSCLYMGVNCEFHCWDSYDAIMNTCSTQCDEGDNSKECRKSCFLDQYQSQRPETASR